MRLERVHWHGALAYVARPKGSRIGPAARHQPTAPRSGSKFLRLAVEAVGKPELLPALDQARPGFSHYIAPYFDGPASGSAQRLPPVLGDMSSAVRVGSRARTVQRPRLMTSLL